MEDSKNDKFIAETGASPADASKYLSKYSSKEEAVRVYKKHQETIKKFMEQQKCDRETAVNFL